MFANLDSVHVLYNTLYNEGKDTMYHEEGGCAPWGPSMPCTDGYSTSSTFTAPSPSVSGDDDDFRYDDDFDLFELTPFNDFDCAKSTDIVSSEYHNEFLCFSEMAFLLILMHYKPLNVHLEPLFRAAMGSKMSKSQSKGTSTGTRSFAPPAVIIALKQSMVDLFCVIDVDAARLRDLMEESNRLFSRKQIAYDADDSDILYIDFVDSDDAVEDTVFLRTSSTPISPSSSWNVLSFMMQ